MTDFRCFGSHAPVAFAAMLRTPMGARGSGIVFMKRPMDLVSCTRQGDRNVLEIFKNLKYLRNSPPARSFP
jgi:hypothetical protein